MGNADAMSLPSNPTASFVKRNPHLYGRPTAAENATVDPDAVPAGQEGKLQRDIAADLDARHWPYVWHRMDCPTTTAKGVPDFIVAAPGRTLWVECKTRTGKLSVEQQLWRQRLEGNGHTYHVVRSMSEWLRIAEEA
jgi:hypothetical protein